QEPLRCRPSLELARPEQSGSNIHRVVDADTTVVLGLFRVVHLFPCRAAAVLQCSTITAQRKIPHIRRVRCNRARTGAICRRAPDGNKAIEASAIVDPLSIWRPDGR